MTKEQIDESICELAGVDYEMYTNTSSDEIFAATCTRHVVEITLDIMIRAKDKINKQAYMLGTRNRYFIETYINSIKVIFGGKGFETAKICSIDYDKKTFETALYKALTYCV